MRCCASIDGTAIRASGMGSDPFDQGCDHVVLPLENVIKCDI
jgi:hypothetical protein